MVSNYTGKSDDSILRIKEHKFVTSILWTRKDKKTNLEKFYFISETYMK